MMDAEKQRTASEKEHLAKSAAFTEIEAKVKTLEKKLSRHIEKSKPYFEQKDVFNKALNAEKSRVQQLQVFFFKAVFSDFLSAFHFSAVVGPHCCHKIRLCAESEKPRGYQ